MAQPLIDAAQPGRFAVGRRKTTEAVADGRVCGGSEPNGVDSTAAAGPSTNNPTDARHRTQQRYERLCRAVGTGHAVDVEAHVRMVMRRLAERTQLLVLALGLVA